MSPGPTRCSACGELISFLAMVKDWDGSMTVLCHECNSDKERLMGEHNKDQAWLHDRKYHGSKNDGEW